MARRRGDQPVDQTQGLDLVAPPERLDDALHVAATLAGVLDEVEILVGSDLLDADGSERLSLRKILPFVAQSHTPSDHCVRFAPAVADDCATLASRRRATTLPGPIFHWQERVSFA
jgi:hypothetical protein